MIPRQIGELRHLVTLQSYTAAKNGFGEDVQTWADSEPMWACIESLSGSETMIASQVKATASHKITIRYNSNVTPLKRFTLGARTFEINSVDDGEQRGIYMTCVCSELVA